MNLSWLKKLTRIKLELRVLLLFICILTGFLSYASGQSQIQVAQTLLYQVSYSKLKSYPIKGNLGLFGIVSKIKTYWRITPEIELFLFNHLHPTRPPTRHYNFLIHLSVSLQCMDICIELENSSSSFQEKGD